MCSFSLTLGEGGVIVSASSLSKGLNVLLSIDGAGAAPRMVGLRELGKLLAAFEEAVLKTARLEGERPSETEHVALVEPCPAMFCCHLWISPSAAIGIDKLITAVADGNVDVLPFGAQQALYRLFETAQARGWTVEWSIPDARPEAAAVISAERPIPKPQARRGAGTTSIHGRLLHVGGKTPGGAMELANGEVLHFSIAGEELAKELAGRLYEEVGLVGRAAWDPADWTIHSFEACGLTGYRKTDPVEAFRALAKAAGTHWDEVDAQEFVRQQRGGDDE